MQKYSNSRILAASDKLSKPLQGCVQPHVEQTKNPNSCTHCGSRNVILGAGKKPGEESRRCGDCKYFLGYTPLARLNKARKRKEFSECLQVLEDSGIQGELALFILSSTAEGGEA